MSKKKFVFYFDNSSQPIVVYEGTPTNDLIVTVKQVFKFPLNQSLLFLDDEGTPVVLSSYLPDGIQLFIQKNQTETEKFEENLSQLLENTIKKKESIVSNFIEQKPFTWLEPRNNSHKLKNNNLTVYQPSNQSYCDCFADIEFSEGIHYFVLLVDPIVCCIAAGVCHPSYKSSFDFKGINLGFSDFPTQFGYGGNFELKKTRNVGILVNFDTKKIVYCDDSTQSIIFEIDLLYTKVSPVVAFKHEVSFTILKYYTGKPDWFK